MYQLLVDGLALDTAGTDGAVSEVSPSISMANDNAVQVEVLVYALTATSVSFTIQISNDAINWRDYESAQTMSSIGRKVLTATTGLAAAHVRVLFDLSGSGKAIVRAGIHRSRQ